MRGNWVDTITVRQVISRINGCSLGEQVGISIIDDVKMEQITFIGLITSDTFVYPVMQYKVPTIKPIGYNQVQIFAHK